MKYSAGLLISTHYKGELKYLVCHPIRASWYGRHDIPKGGYLPKEETPKEAALRETLEEIGLAIPKELINNNPEIVEYRNSKGKVYKKVSVFRVHINIEDFKDNFTDLIVNKENLQLEEVDWAGFLNLEELEKRLFHRFKILLNN